MRAFANAYWDRLFYDSDIFIHGRGEEWPETACEHARYLIPMTASSKVEKAEINSQILELCDGPRHTLLDACKSPPFAMEMVCRVYEKHGRDDCHFSGFKRFAEDIALCDKGRMSACESMAENYAEAETYVKGHVCVPAPETTRRLYKQFCKEGQNRICAALAAMLYFGDGGEKNFEEARKAAYLACNTGKKNSRRNDACILLAQTYLEGQGGKQDTRKGVSILKNECSDNDIRACMHLAAYAAKSQDEKATLSREIGNRSKNVKLSMETYLSYKKSCDTGNKDACYVQGRLSRWRLPEGISPEEQNGRAIRVLEKNCDDGHARSCVELGDRYDRAEWVELNPEKAKAYYKKACKLDDTDSCN